MSSCVSSQLTVRKPLYNYLCLSFVPTNLSFGLVYMRTKTTGKTSANTFIIQDICVLFARVFGGISIGHVSYCYAIIYYIILCIHTVAKEPGIQALYAPVAKETVDVTVHDVTISSRRRRFTEIIACRIN